MSVSCQAAFCSNLTFSARRAVIFLPACFSGNRVTFVPAESADVSEFIAGTEVSASSKDVQASSSSPSGVSVWRHEAGGLVSAGISVSRVQACCLRQIRGFAGVAALGGRLRRIFGEIGIVLGVALSANCR